MPREKPFLPKIIVPSEPSFNFVSAPSERVLNRSTTIKISEQVIEINPDNVKPVRSLGHGAYGFVDLIQHEPSGVQLAVKRISASMLQDEDRLLRDMDVLVKSKGCPQIVEFYGAIFWDGHLCLFMEILDASLDKFYRKAYEMVPDSDTVAPIPEPVIGRIASSVVKALNFLYLLKVIHRDIKPSNILINRRGEVKLCDFGISGYLVNSVVRTYEAGCKPYMAPERLKPNKNGYDILSDVWSLGLTILEIATGKFPYPPGSIFEQMKKVYDDPSPTLPEGRYSADCESFISNCLKKQKNERPKYDVLLQFPFLVTYQDSDISEYACTVLSSMEASRAAAAASPAK